MDSVRPPSAFLVVFDAVVGFVEVTTHDSGEASGNIWVAICHKVNVAPFKITSIALIKE